MKRGTAYFNILAKSKTIIRTSFIVMLLLILVAISGCVSKTEYDTLAGKYAELKEVHEALSAEYSSEINKLKLDYSSVQTELDILKETCPPKRFADMNELEAWLLEQPTPSKSNNANSWYAHARQIQEAGLKDGYIIDAVIVPDYVDESKYVVNCYAVTEDHSLYWWDPETDEIYFWLDVRGF